jgi:hypothetical protein
VKPDISEFSYGYALTDELIHWHGTSLTAAPVFPSLYQEGQQGGGYDAMLQRPGLPLFLQFKLSDCMVRDTAQEVKNGLFNTPYYKMHIRPAKHSEQHEMLLDLEQNGNEVYYSAPAFHTPEELNFAYLNHQVRNRSLWLRPSIVGQLPDDDDHYVAFTIPGAHHFCSSEPRRIETKGDFEEFGRNIQSAYKQRGKAALLKDNLFKTAETIKTIAEKRSGISYDGKRESERKMREQHPLAMVAFYASTFMDCQLFIVSSTEEE